MSKRAEEKALEAYPVKMTPLVYQDLIDQFGGKTDIDVNTYPRCLFQEGYEQAEKEVIERAVAWLKDYVKYFEIYDEKGIEEFKKAMEEEK